MNRKRITLFITPLFIVMILTIGGIWYYKKNAPSPATNKISPSSTIPDTQGMPLQKLNLNDFMNIKIGTPYSAIIEQFGQPKKDIGSGLHIFVYDLSDSTEVLLGFASLNSLFYIKHQLADGTIQSIVGGN